MRPRQGNSVLFAEATAADRRHPGPAGDYPEVHLTSLEEWFRQDGWEGRRMITVKRDKIGRPISGG
jgi:hypothetical protein